MNLSNRTYVFFAFKIIVVLAVFYWVLSKSLYHYSSKEIIDFQYSIFNNGGNFLWLAFVLILMPLNWFIESKKWSISLKGVYKISRISSFKSVLAGVALGIFTPNRIGEFAGRVLTLPLGHRTQGIFSNAICSLSQLTTTLVIGSISLIALIPNYLIFETNLIVTLVQLILATFSILVLLFYTRSSRLLKLISKIKWLKKILNQPALKVKIPKEILPMLLGNSVVRYTVFFLQFVSILTFYEVELNGFFSLIYIPIIYLTLAIVPTIALSELGIREGVSIAVLSGISDNTLGIISASFTLWIINIAIPALFGSLVLLQLKYQSKIAK